MEKGKNQPCRTIKDVAELFVLQSGNVIGGEKKPLIACKEQRLFIEKQMKDLRGEGVKHSSERSKMPYIRFKKDLGYPTNSDQYITYTGLVPYLDNLLNPKSDFFNKKIYDNIKLAIPIIEKIKNEQDVTEDFSNLEIIHFNGSLSNITPNNLKFIKRNEMRECALRTDYVFQFLNDTELYNEIQKLPNRFEDYLTSIRIEELKPIVKKDNFTLEIMGEDPIIKNSKVYVYNKYLNKYISTGIPRTFLQRFREEGRNRKISKYPNIDWDYIDKTMSDSGLNNLLKQAIKRFCDKNNIDDYRIFIKENGKYIEVTNELYKS